MAIPSRADPALAIYGDRVKVSFATRTIVITPSTNYVNVTGGEIIRFVVGNKSMAWNFNGRSGSFDLARAAPALIDHKVTAYIAPNPYYPRSGG
ncbi:MAG: CzcE family metal-binding protein [Proteobacteria bacterium]|nr:CzcE family metal-binding protein [Pseudomonadota bacterium]